MNPFYYVITNTYISRHHLYKLLFKKNTMTDKKPRILLLQISILVALVGFITALYLFYMEVTKDFACLINAGIFDCKAVNQSVYAKILGIPVSLLGIMFYLAVIIVSFLAIFTKNKYWLSFFLPAAGVIGFLFSIYLTVIEAFVLVQFCEFCLVSAICSLALFILIIFAKRANFPSLFAQLDFWNMFKKEETY